jgi:hypothetical protein
VQEVVVIHLQLILLKDRMVLLEHLIILALL